jgi:4-amino-4-deoxy-L-arabinose transferase-like glycosyltransferase
MLTAGEKPGVAPQQPWYRLREGMPLAVGLAVLSLILHVYFNNRYGYFRDEFDYIACGEHPAWGYVDHPPLIPFLVKLCRMIFGDSLRSIRLIPALAISAATILTAAITRHLGGRRDAMLLSVGEFLVAPIYLSGASLLTTNCLEPLLWMGCVYALIWVIKDNDPRYWLLFGAAAGVGLLEKYSIAVFAASLVGGLLLCGRWRLLLNRWCWAGAAVAFVIFLPNFLWNVQHGWPFLELMRNIRASGRDIELPPGEFLAQQFLLLQPLAAPLWITGLIALLISRRMRSYQFLGWSYLITFTFFLVSKGKNYYLAPAYPMLLSAGAVAFADAAEQWRRPWLKPAYAALLVASGLWLAPIVVPVLPVDSFLAYMRTLPFELPHTEKGHLSAQLPQHYADQFGWEEMTANVAQAWNRIPASERADCAIFGQNYGQAGAIDFLGRRYGLPASLSGHQTYWLWGPGDYSGNCMIVLDDRKEVLEQMFRSVEYAGQSDNPYALERNIPVFICKGKKFESLQAIWPRLKKWR